MRTKKLGLIALFGLLAFVVSPLGIRSTLAENDPGPAVAEDAPAATAAQLSISPTGLYIVQLADPSLSSYEGGIAGLAPTAPRATGERRLDAASPASLAYLDYLSGKQSEFIAQMDAALGRPVEVAFQYLSALNALAVRVEHAEAIQLMGLPGVKAVFADTLREMDTDVGPIHIGAPAIWNGETLTGDATRGEGIVIGMIDSGINSEHPSFAETDGFGYTHTNPYGSGVFHGWCVANPSFCNDKLIAAYSFNPVGTSPEDTDGHGSHTGSTAGGNAHDATFSVGPTEYTILIQGVAPRANMVAYKVCNPSCPGTASIAAVNSAIQNDEVDVLNYSISGSDSPWTDPVDLAFLDAFNAGIFVSASAGNTGPGASTVAKTGPWNASVGASTINRIIANTVDVTAPTQPAELQGIAAVPGTGPAIAADINDDIEWAGDIDPNNIDACDPFAGGSFTGSIALVQRGGCTFVVKVTNATAAGATGVIVYNNVGGPPITMGGLEATAVPSVFIDNASGAALADYVSNNVGPTVRINVETSLIVDDAWEDVIAGFSARGPSQFELVKPDYVAPGVNTFAAVAADGGDPVQYGFNQGTSMSSPHGAGSAALMMALHPTWSPAEIKSALATAADPDVLVKEDGVTPATPYDQGHGLLQLGAAANVGLVFDETGQNYIDANPATGGDPKTLNQPSMANYECAGECTWTRTVTSVMTDTVTYNATFSSDVAIDVTITPSQFTLEPGEDQVLTITADTSALPAGVAAFAQVNLVPAAAAAPSGGGSAEFTSTPNIAITDDGYNGTQGSMACDLIDASSIPGGSTVTNVTVDLAADHTWIGDLTIKLFSPDASVLGVMSRPGYVEPLDDGNGCCGDSTNLSSAFPILFTDASADDAETMGNTILTGDIVCSTDGRCDYFPNPGAVVGLTDFASFAGENASGDWTLCLSDSASGDLGTFVEWTLTVDYTGGGGGGLAVQQLPMVVIPSDFNPDPAITVDPASLESEQTADTQVDQILTIGNTGGTALDWSIVEESTVGGGFLQAAGPALPAGSSSGTIDIGDGLVLGNSGAAAASGGTNVPLLAPSGNITVTHNVDPDTIETPSTIACAQTGGGPTRDNAYLRVFDLANDFGIPGPFEITNVQFGVEVSTLTTATFEVEVNLYTLDGPLNYANMTPIGSATVDITADDLVFYNVPVSGTVPAGEILVAEVYVPDGLPTAARIFLGSNNNGQTDPSYIASVACGLAQPTDLASIGFPDVAMIINVSGNAETAACDASDIPWLSVDPTSGSVDPAGSDAVTVTFDSTGLTPGQYTGTLCVESNDPVTPIVYVPVTMDVVDLPEIVVDPASLAFTIPIDTQADDTLTIENVGVSDLDWEIFEDSSIAALLADWSDNFDSYATGANLQGLGGWKGWDNSPAAAAFTTDDQARSTPNSVDIVGPADLVHEYSLTSGTAVYTAWQYIPSGFTGESYFILLNTYSDGGPYNWSVQVTFDGTSGMMTNTGASGGTMAFLTNQWVEIRVEIDLDADTQSFFYNNNLLYSGTWTDEVSGGGALAIAAVDLFANGASSVFYDDLSLVQPPVTCDAPEDISWLSVAPTSGTTEPGGSDDVTVSVDATGLTIGETYEAALCVASNDPANPVVTVPVSLTVGEVADFLIYLPVVTREQ